jgi:glucose/arabinose dehydrogenase
VDTATGQVTRVGVIDDVIEQSESELMGMAFHPDFPATPYIYFAHSYDNGGNDIRNRLIQMRFDGATLANREILLQDIPGNFNHNGSRLAIGSDRLIYMTTGDAQGPNLAVELPSLAGKILRLTLDGRVPANNPFRTEIYSRPSHE